MSIGLYDSVMPFARVTPIVRRARVYLRHFIEKTYGASCRQCGKWQRIDRLVYFCTIRVRAESSAQFGIPNPSPWEIQK
jgi:hypothetical protein